MSSKSDRKEYALRRPSMSDPNATNCALCTEKDTADMAECQNCKRRYHFRCAQLDGSKSLLNWICAQCKISSKKTTQSASTDDLPSQVVQSTPKETTVTVTNPSNVDGTTTVTQSSSLQESITDQANADLTVTNVGTQSPNTVGPTKSASIPSSTSSKRKNRLKLERLMKEKAIQEKLIEDKANAGEKLMEDKAKLEADFLRQEYAILEDMSDDEIDDMDPQEKKEYVTDWVNTTEPTATETEDQQQTRRHIDYRIDTLKDMIRSLDAIQDFQLIQQQGQRILDESKDEPSSHQANAATNQPSESTLSMPPSNVQSTQPQRNGATKRQDGEEANAHIDPYTSTYLGTTDPPQFIVDLINQQPKTPISARFTSMVNRPDTTLVQPTPSSVPNMVQQPPTPLPAVSNVNQSQPSALVTQQQLTNAVTSMQQSTPNTNSGQPATVNSAAPVPRMQGHQSTVSQQQLTQTSMVPSMRNQQHVPISQTPVFHGIQSSQNITQPTSATFTTATTSMTGQPISNYVLGNAPNMIGNSQIPSSSSYTTQMQSVQIQGVTYDPELNPYQLPPTKLQLACRQTMPKAYPKFNGDPERWAIFRNAYVNVTTSCGLSNGENLSRLEECLKDPARKAVKNLLTRPESVPEIMETLKMLYGRPEASIEAQIKAIRSEARPNMNKMESFINFSMSVRNVTNEIQKSGMWQYLWNPQLMQELSDRLPTQMLLEWGQIKMITPNANLSTFSDWLYTKAQNACAVTLPTTENRNDKSNTNSHINTHSNGNGSNKKTSYGNRKHLTNSKGMSCRVCDKTSHNTVECRKFLGMSLNERWETIKSKQICRICLGDHNIIQCDSKSLCGEAGCTIKHHRLLHNPAKTSVAATNTNSTSSNVHNSSPQCEMILRRYIPVTLYGPKGSMNVVAFLDDGSDFTLVENWIAQKLGISGEQEDLFLKWTAKIVRKEPNSQSISIKISGTRTNSQQYEIKGARTVKSLNLPQQTIDADKFKDDFKFLRRIPFESYFDETPKILIGLLDCKLSTPLKSRSAGWNEPIAVKTRLGWEIHGSSATSAQIANLNFHAADDTTDNDHLHQMITEFFSLENFGVKKPEQTIEALSDKRARELLESTTKCNGTRFETGLLWKYDEISLPESLPMAKRRLESLEKRLEKDPHLGLLFRTKFNDYIKNGYVRKLSEEEIAETNGRTWYLPLFPVTYPKKPGKIRLVWDAAAKVGNISLNSMLLPGPDMLVSLPGVLYRFREGRFVVSGDIREMFHQITIQKEDETAQRFLMREQGSSKIDVYVLQVLSFGATCSPASAQYVKNHNALRFIDTYPRAEEAIRMNTYVDDWLQSFDTEADAENVANEVTFVHSQGGFEIRNWLSNSPQVSRSLGVSPEDEQKLSLDPAESQQERILGMWWNVKDDSFTYSLRYNPLNKDILFNGRRPTKREALRTLMTIFDPIGLLAHYLVQLKMILQDIWRVGIGWDEQVKEKDGDNLYARCWSNWIALLPEIEKISIQRHYSTNMMKQTKVQLHVFVDASELAYATVAYFRIEDHTSTECSLIGGKTKVAPLKPLSVPRMELQAAVLGSRFKNSIIQNHTLEVTKTVIWSDSTTVLSWLRSDLRRYTQYVGARVNEILETTALPEWRWIPSELNPADDATKWKHSFNLDNDSRWFRGPDFLRQSEEHWPKEQHQVSETTEELRPKYADTNVHTVVENLEIKFEHFHQWKRTMAFVLRFINNVKAKLKKPGYIARYGQLLREELQDGETALYRRAQLDEFPSEIYILQEKAVNGRYVSVEKTSPIYQYSPYLDYANVLRMRGRIDAMPNVSFDVKWPIILPTRHPITEMVVKEYHRRYHHQYTETVVNEVKQKFVIPKLRALHKRIRRNCQHCKNLSAQPRAPEMAQLPAGRLASFTRPYTFVGVDYAGPYKIISFRRTVKRWIVIFTCLTIRAVYIDVVESLNTDSCIMAIRRFIARNGAPNEFYSDPGTNFVGANNELKREMNNIDQERLKTTFTSCYTQWNFIPPSSQHMGGAWERLIRSMKRTLDKILPKSHYPNHETLVTALAEVENIINSRPLTFVSIEPDDTEALTPNHFLKGSSNGNKPPGVFPPPPHTLRGNWRYAQQIANEFWKKWVKEYLPMITRRTKWFEDVKPIKIGDQVIIIDETAPRNMWDRGVVIETPTGRNGRVSKAKVRTMDGVYTRPVVKLAVLDLIGSEAKPLTREALAGGSVTASNDGQVAVTSVSQISTRN